MSAPVPARVGGVDLSDIVSLLGEGSRVPARVGGVDLSYTEWHGKNLVERPRPCGRGGFKPFLFATDEEGRRPRPCGRGGFKPAGQCYLKRSITSPPVWAGWI